MASVFYTVLLGTLLKSEGFNGREQRNHPATLVVYSDFFGGDFSNSFGGVNMNILHTVESSCLFVLNIMLSVFTDVRVWMTLRGYKYASSFEGIMEGIMEPEKPRCA